METDYFDFEDQPKVQYADFGTRLLALIIDAVIIWILIIAILALFVVPVFLAEEVGEDISGIFTLGLILYYFFGIPLTGILYRTFFEASSQQGTPGKIMMKIKVVNRHNERISFGQALGRNLARILSSFLFIGYLIALGNDKCRTLHDQMADTNVIKKQPPRLL